MPVRTPEHMENMRKERIIQWKFWWRPPKYTTVKDLEEVIDEYFEIFNHEDNLIKFNDKQWNEIWWDYKKLPTVTWLAIYLWFVSRRSLIHYENKEEWWVKKFFPTIKRAKLFIENFTEERLLMWKWNATGLIFNLKNNFDWKDSSDVNQNVKVEDVTVKLPT